MKSPLVGSVGVAMATKCSSGVSVTTDSPVIHMRSHRSHRNPYANHRKSAVELLAASKAEYVKSTEVLNHKQELKHPENLSVGNRELLSLSLSPSQNSELEDVSNFLTENNNNRKSSEDRIPTPSKPFHLDHNHSNHITHLKNEENSHGTPTSSPLPSSSVNSHSSLSNSDENGSKFKKPVTPPKILPKPSPVVPPRLASTAKPTTPPKPAPRSTSQGNPTTPGKPVPPPRPSHKSCSTSVTAGLDITDSPSVKMSAAANDIKVVNNISTGATNSTSPELNTKRYSSLSAHASLAVPKDQSDLERNSSVSSRSRETRNSLSSQSDSLLKPLCTSTLSTSVGVLAEKKRFPVPRPRGEKQFNEIDIPRRRQLHRSHSDLSSCRHSRTSSDFSDLSSRLSRTSTEVERFFNEMGIDRTVLEPMRKLADFKHKDFLDNLSSLDSQDGHSLSSHTDLDKLPMESEQDLMERSTASGTTSVVERNARIIKWLCNVKKARTAPGKQSKPVARKS